MTNINLASRIQIRDEDNTTGSYPTISRTSTDRPGTFGSRFDDTNSIVFIESTQITLPAGLPLSSPFITDQTSSFTSVTGAVRKGIADGIAIFSTGQILSAFDDSLHPEQSVYDNFHETGSTLATVGFGFTSPLRSKTKLTVNLNQSLTTTLQLSSSLNNDRVDGTGSYPMAYYNFDKVSWENVGQGTGYNTNSPTADGQPDHNLATQMLGFSPSFLGDGNIIGNSSQSAIPFDAFGFPTHQKFHATSSQVYPVSNLIDKPFLVEKVIYECSASFSGTGDFIEQSEGLYNTFFVLNQRGPFSASISNGPYLLTDTKQLTTSIPSGIILSQNGSPTYVDTQRDIVTWLQVASFSSTINSSSSDHSNFALREKNIISTTGANWSDKLILSGVAKTPAKVGLHSSFNDNDDVNEEPVTYRFGGRGNLGKPSGRDLVSGFVSNIGNTPIALTDFNKATVISGTSPYIIMPGDKLIFGWQVAQPGSPVSVANAFNPTLTLPPASGRLTLYGSYICDAQEIHDSLNQQLTTNAVHEDVRGTGIIHDQFDVEQLTQFSGTINARFLTGTIGLAESRRVQASTISFDRNVSHHKLLSGSFIPGFIRGTQHTSENERFFDTLLPDPAEITALNGVLVEWQSNGGTLANQNMINLGHVMTGDSNTDTTWPLAFPFEPKYSSLNRNLTLPTVADQTFIPGVTRRSPMSIKRSNDLLFSTQRYSLLNAKDRVSSAGDFTHHSAASSRDMLLHYYGTGDFFSGSVKPFEVRSDKYIFGSVHRGFKYGILNPIKQFTKAIFKRDHYGYFRDMLEQRLDAKFYDIIGLTSDGIKSGGPALRTSPITIRFVASGSNTAVTPITTDSSNLSHEATSSLPYFDGVSRN